MQSWPTPNVGILGRWAPGIDSDAENEEAHRLVEDVVIQVFGRAAGIAERIRGDSPRRLYAFRCRDPKSPDAWVRTRHLAYRLAGEDDLDPIHKIDVIGIGNQYVIAGTHPSGAPYKWASGYDLADMVAADELERVDDAAIARFLEAFEEELTARGGVIINRRGGAAPGEERDHSAEDPIFPVRDIFDGLDRIPNSEANFPSRDDFVSILAKIRAALGSEAEGNREHVEAWATENPEWCPPEYFDKAWESLSRGVRVGRYALDEVFRRHGVFTSARADFPDDAHEVSKLIRADIEARKTAEAAAIDLFASTYVVSDVNYCRNEGTLQLRRREKPDSAFKGVDWWRYWDSDPNTAVLDAIHATGKYPATEKGFYAFLRDVRKRHPTCFFSGETLDPRYDRGVVVVEERPQGKPSHRLNMRFQSPVILAARQSPRCQKQAASDLETLLEFIGRVFGPDTNYELDTLAYMVQSGKRPGHLLFLVGEPGVGKSTYNHMLTAMFDGIGQGMGGQIDGTKLVNEGARRFALARVEGCRILSIKELPKGSTAHTMAQITSTLKQMVDPGADGDYFQIERKGKDIETVRNFMRVVITSNYETSLRVEENDRRIFYVRCGITIANKPDLAYYDRLNEVVSKPERLATLWRYLKTRDVRDYKPAKAPPVSDGKLEAQVTAMANPWERYAAAAIWLLRVSGREMFDVRELSDLMGALGDNEYRNTGGAVNDRSDFDFRAAKGPAQAALRYLSGQADKVGGGKDGRGYKIEGGTKRLPVIYALKGTKVAHRLASAGRDDVLDALDRDRDRNRLREDHPMQRFAGPVRLPES
ncbi:hypothetical protein BY998_11493 [Methylobacterium sp. B4]|nr:hypothetical protein BY998_11493 [Methylobacterium sp. B4]